MAESQPPSAREIVISGVFRRGDVDDSDLATVPKDIGIRFEPAAAPSLADSSLPILTRRNGAPARIDRAVHFELDATRVADGAATPVPSDLVTIVANPTDTDLAEAALRAALDAGIPWSEFTQRVVVVWGDADASRASTVPPDARIVRMPVPSPPPAAADAVRGALMGDSRVGLLEPVMITADSTSRLVASARAAARGRADRR
jgi:hypothetical protein